MIIAYSEKGGRIIKTLVGSRSRASYDAVIDTPLHKRALDGYYALECQGKLGDLSEFGGARRVAELHRQRLEQ